MTGYREPSVRHHNGVLCVISHIFACWTSLTVTHVIFFNIECGVTCFLCTIHVFNVQALSSPRRLPLCQILFVLWPHWWAWRKIAYSINHSLTQWLTQLIWCPENRSFHFGICSDLWFKACMVAWLVFVRWCLTSVSSNSSLYQGVQTLRTQDTSDLSKFGPRTLRHDRSVPTLRHWCRSVLRTFRH